MADQYLYLTTTGRKTGLPRQIEIWYVELSGRWYMVSERGERSRWVMNIRADPAVVFSVGTRAAPASTVPETRALARVVSADVEPALASSVRACMDDKYGWSEGLIVELAPRR